MAEFLILLFFFPAPRQAPVGCGSFPATIRQSAGSGHRHTVRGRPLGQAASPSRTPFHESCRVPHGASICEIIVLVSLLAEFAQGSVSSYSTHYTTKDDKRLHTDKVSGFITKGVKQLLGASSAAGRIQDRLAPTAHLQLYLHLAQNYYRICKKRPLNGHFCSFSLHWHAFCLWCCVVAMVAAARKEK